LYQGIALADCRKYSKSVAAFKPPAATLAGKKNEFFTLF